MTRRASPSNTTFWSSPSRRASFYALCTTFVLIYRHTRAFIVCGSLVRHLVRASLAPSIREPPL